MKLWSPGCPGIISTACSFTTGRMSTINPGGYREEPAEKWQDIAKRDVYAKTVSGYIEALHARNMMAANYNLMFGAYETMRKRAQKRNGAFTRMSIMRFRITTRCPTGRAAFI